MDEKRLVALLKNGNEEAFRVLVRNYKARIFKIAYGITLDSGESEDIVQDVFLSVFRNIGKFKQESKLSTWLHRMTVNHCLNWQRRWKRRFRKHHRPIESDEKGEIPELGTEKDLPETLYGEKELKKVLWDKLAELPEDARAVFVLKESEGLSYDEIAEVLKIKKGTVSSRLFYARKKLKKSLEKYMNED